VVFDVAERDVADAAVSVAVARLTQAGESDKAAGMVP